jgi:hypothetical protein
MCICAKLTVKIHKTSLILRRQIICQAGFIALFGRSGARFRQNVRPKAVLSHPETLRFALLLLLKLNRKELLWLISENQQ